MSNYLKYISENFGDDIIKLFAHEMASFGDDKVLHYTGSVMLSEMYGESEDGIISVFEGFIESLETGLAKEFADKGISSNSDCIKDMLRKLDLIKTNFSEIIKTVNELKMDRGDLYADLTGIFVGCALMTVKKMAFELDTK